MKERLRLSDLSILYVCLSDAWGTTERRCLADATYFRNIGGSAIILCHEKSFLDKESKSEDIPRIYFSGEVGSLRSKLNFYFQIQYLLQKQPVDLIHTYNYETLVPLGAILNRLPLVPLVYTFNESMHWQESVFWEKWFIARTDLVLTFSSNIRDLAIESFPLSQRKIHVTGVGLDFPPQLSHLPRSQDKKKVTIFIPRTEKNLQSVKVLLDAIPSILFFLKEKKQGLKLVFTFLTDMTWYEHPLYESLKRMILERHLEMSISFETRPLSSSSFQDCDVFIGLPLEELFTDLDLLALVSQVPVLLPRTSTRQQVIKQGRYGETYHPEDRRELKDKLVAILTNHSHYLEQLQEGSTEFCEQHHFEKYAENLYVHYEKICAQRIRFAHKKKKLA